MDLGGSMSEDKGTTGTTTTEAKKPKWNEQKAHFMVERLRRLSLQQLGDYERKLIEIRDATSCPYCKGQIIATTNTMLCFGKDILARGTSVIFFGCPECVKTKAKMLQGTLPKPPFFTNFRLVALEFDALLEWRARVDQEEKDLRTKELRVRVRGILEAESSGETDITDEMVEEQVLAMLGATPESTTQT